MPPRGSVIDQQEDDLEDDLYSIDDSDDEEQENEDELEDSEEQDSDEDDVDETEPEQPQTKKPARTNWEARFKGLQKTVQQKEEQLQQMRQAQMVIEHNAFESQIAALPDDQKGVLRQLFMVEMASKYRLSQAQDAETRANEAARQIYIREMAQTHGVPARLLDKYDTPEEIEHTAKALAAQQRRNQKRNTQEVKKAAGTKPKFGSGGKGDTGFKPAASLDEAAARLRKYKI